jgi:hypothetical protein
VHTVFALTAAFPLIVCASALLIDEQPVRPGYWQLGTADSDGPPGTSPRRGGGGALAAAGEKLRAQVVALWGAVSTKDILLPTIFVFLWQVGGRGGAPGGVRCVT